MPVCTPNSCTMEGRLRSRTPCLRNSSMSSEQRQSGRNLLNSLDRKVIDTPIMRLGETLSSRIIDNWLLMEFRLVHGMLLEREWLSKCSEKWTISRSTLTCAICIQSLMGYYPGWLLIPVPNRSCNNWGHSHMLSMTLIGASWVPVIWKRINQEQHETQ